MDLKKKIHTIFFVVRFHFIQKPIDYFFIPIPITSLSCYLLNCIYKKINKSTETISLFCPTTLHKIWYEGFVQLTQSHHVT